MSASITLKSEILPLSELHKRERLLIHKEPSRLRLGVYRKLGIDIEADKTGSYNKAIIRNSQKGDVHVLNIDPKVSQFFYANYFWQTI